MKVIQIGFISLFLLISTQFLTTACPTMLEQTMLENEFPLPNGYTEDCDEKYFDLDEEDYFGEDSEDDLRHSDDEYHPFAMSDFCPSDCMNSTEESKS